ncbi:MAG: LacI family DNA-binding transcriptional regulator [Deltaproteobacteria bacterium]|nr:LacI family DNA-binding transcriptional regulator [Deltaproteobacteria bacterium]MBW2050859.1 LacI family DNA-binding transcriptional regulator [Deltaproteobacteria bacterium]MBW2140179.1 LacI family DNA-binding transcriptional regulator [Deltaproteobacteria bacterium]MBW2322298.1 LacI family DNA-binding transcriptional regulator [Deltaproteobacteria bacterium]
MGKITIKEIAKLAGVSNATVSRVIHSPHLVNQKTRERIQQVMESNNYVYDAVAGDLSRKKASVIGLIIPTIKNSIFSSTVYGIQEKAEEGGYTTIIGNSNYDTKSELNIMTLFQQRRIAGLILTGLSEGVSKRIREFMQLGIPSVVTWEKLDSSDICYAGFDNFKAAYSMTNHLIGLRHKRIGLIIGPYTRVRRVRSRLDGYKTALNEHSIPFDSDFIFESEYTLVDGKEAMQRLLSLPDPPTAVFAASDVLAMGALTAVKENGLRVPQDISIAGFDDLDFTAYLDPPLTTVRIPAFEMGQLAVKMLFEMIDGEMNQVRQYCLDTDLIIRQSCAEPALDNISL